MRSGSSAAKLSLRRYGFGHNSLDVFLVEQYLPLQVALLYKIPVDNAQRADTRSRKQRSLHRAKGSAADNDDARSDDSRLPLLTNSLE